MDFWPRRYETFNRLYRGRDDIIARQQEGFNPDHYNPDPDFSILEEVDPIDREWVDRWVRE